MSYAPKHIADMRGAWVAAGGTDLGIVGDSAHPSGYHIGADRIYSAAGQGDADYSVQLARDRAGLTNAASAFDFGHASLDELRRYSRWLVDYCAAGGPASEWVREIIYSPDGNVVQRWSGVDKQIHPGWPTATGNGDASHRYHTHLSLFRDAEGAKANLLPLVTTWAQTPPDTATEGAVSVELIAFPWYVRAGTTLSGYDPNRPGGPIVTATPETDQQGLATGPFRISYPGTPQDQWLAPFGAPFLLVHGGTWDGLYILRDQVSLEPLTAPAPELPPIVIPPVALPPSLDTTTSADGQTVTVRIVQR